MESTTFSGRRFTRKQLAKVVETIHLFPNLSRTELAFTLCEHLSWKSPNGSLKVNSAVEFLEKLETLGLVVLPAGRGTSDKKGPDKIVLTTESEEKTALCGSLDEISPIDLRLVDTAEERGLWNEFMARYHYLGYKRPFGAYLRYFVVAKDGSKIGCLLFASSAWALACRDEWIGWKNWHRAKHLHLIVSNSRFLIFPWVRVPNLASHILSLIPGRIGIDWQRKYRYKPVLIETFVDQEKYAGTCYKAANWQYLGKTKGQGRFYKTNQSVGSIKDVYVYPLESSFRNTLIRGRQSQPKKPVEITNYSNEKFIEFWDKVVHIVNEVAAEFDEKWQIRKRVIDSMLLIMLIFRLVSSKARQGYGSTIDDLWENCRTIRLPLPKKVSIAASSFAVARRKLDETVFKKINERIVATYGKEIGNAYRWQGHRIFAIDGTKINLPRQLISSGYRVPSPNAHYPQGMVSCIYQLHAKIPWDFDLTEHSDERKCVPPLLNSLMEGDVVVYDRGYFSVELFFHHLKTGVHAIFRLSESTCKPIKDFIASNQTDAIVSIYPSQKMKQGDPDAYSNTELEPVRIRLIRYTVLETTYFLGTTLLDSRYNADAFPDAYHSRWGIEELYKVSKQIIGVEEFHAKTLRGVKQELYAHFVLITMNRIFANHTDGPRTLGKSRDSVDLPIQEGTEVRANFKNCINAFVRNIEALFLQKAETLKQTIVSVIARVSRRHQKVRPDRHYPRLSMKPVGKWKHRKVTQSAAAA